MTSSNLTCLRYSLRSLFFYPLSLSHFLKLLIANSSYIRYNSFMALPTNLAAKLKSIPMDPTVLATDLELAYLLSFSQHRTSILMQPLPASPSTYIHVNLIIHLSKIISMPSSKTRLMNSCCSKPSKITNPKTDKLPRAFDAVSKNFMHAWQPTHPQWL